MGELKWLLKTVVVILLSCSLIYFVFIFISVSHHMDYEYAVMNESNSIEASKEREWFRKEFKLYPHIWKKDSMLSTEVWIENILGYDRFNFKIYMEEGDSIAVRKAGKKFDFPNIDEMNLMHNSTTLQYSALLKKENKKEIIIESELFKEGIYRLIRDE